MAIKRKNSYRPDLAKRLSISVVLSNNPVVRNLDIASEVLFILLKKAGLISPDSGGSSKGGE